MPNLGSLLLLALPVLLLVFMFTTQRRKQREMQDVQDRLAPGQEVITTAGLYAKIVSVDETTLLLETAPGQTVRWDKRAIMKVVDATPADEPSTETDEK